jgi:hypothetical protein
MSSPSTISGAVPGAKGPPETVAAAGVAEKTRRTAAASVSAAPAASPRSLVDRGAIVGLARAPRAAVASGQRPRRASLPGWATAVARQVGTPVRCASASRTEPLSFLRDPNLTIEEKLLKLLAHLNAKWEKEMQQKLDKIAAGEGGATKKTSKTKNGALPGNIAGAAAQALGAGGIAAKALEVPAVRTALAKLGGPVLAAAATALGFPALAPALLRSAPAVIQLAAGLAGVAAGDAAAPAGGAKKMSDSERQQIVLEIQRLQEKQKEMFQLVSNVLRVNHDTRTTIIGNIR